VLAHKLPCCAAAAVAAAAGRQLQPKGHLAGVDAAVVLLAQIHRLLIQRGRLSHHVRGWLLRQAGGADAKHVVVATNHDG